MSVALGVPGEYLVVICGLVVPPTPRWRLLGGVLYGQVSVHVSFPIACMLMVLSLSNVGGFSNFVAHAPQGYSSTWLESRLAVSNRLHISQTTGYNNFGNAQRYFCADTEQSA